MKRLLFILLAITMLGCSDDDNANINNNDLIGAWQIMSSTYNGYENVDTSNCDDDNDGKQGVHLTFWFQEDNLYRSLYTCDSTVRDAGMYSVQYDKLILNYGNTDYEEVYKLERTGNKKLRMTLIPVSEGEDKVIFNLYKVN
jgi:hypothetical protein